MVRCQQIGAIAKKRTEYKAIEYLEDHEMRAVLESVDLNIRRGPRDYTLLLFLYNTGARAQEAVDLRVSDVRLEAPYQVKLTGKGRKERVIPLWPETVGAIKTYLNQRELETPTTVAQLFLNTNGHPITRFGIRYIVQRYAAKAAERCSSMQDKKISPHTLRHYLAQFFMPSSIASGPKFRLHHGISVVAYSA
jgi:site-specific recombinase XerD